MKPMKHCVLIRHEIASILGAAGLAKERAGVLGPDLLQPRLCYHIHLHCAYCKDFQTVTLMVREISPTDSCSVMSWTSKLFKEPLKFHEDVNDRGSEWASFGSWLRGDWTAPSTTTWSSSKGRKWSRHPVICIPWQFLQCSIWMWMNLMTCPHICADGLLACLGSLQKTEVHHQIFLKKTESPDISSSKLHNCSWLWKLPSFCSPNFERKDPSFD